MSNTPPFVNYEGGGLTNPPNLRRPCRDLQEAVSQARQLIASGQLTRVWIEDPDGQRIYDEDDILRMG
jgi:hypothetical protein